MVTSSLESAEIARPGAVGCLAGTRIIIVLPSLEMGGAERQALLLARYLAREQAAQVRVWGLGAPGQVARECAAMGLPWRALPVPPGGARIRQLTAFAGFVAALRRACAEILLPYTMVPNVICGLAWQWAGARLCVWNQRDGGIVRMPRRLERAAVRRTPCFVSNSQHGVDFLAATFGLNAAAIQAIPNGIVLAAPEANSCEWRQRLALDERAFVACMVANLTHHKDHDTLLKAWRIVRDRLALKGREAVLLLAGQFGDRYEALQAQAKELQLGESVRFLGQVTDVSGLLAITDLGILSSLSEGSPNGLLECMAAGKAVVGTDVSGIREAVGPDGMPFLAPPGDAAGLADCILSLAEDPVRRAWAAETNRRRIEARFSAQSMGERMLSVCCEGLERNRRAQAPGH